MAHFISRISRAGKEWYLFVGFDNTKKPHDGLNGDTFFFEVLKACFLNLCKQRWGWIFLNFKPSENQQVWIFRRLD
ncbi:MULTISPECIES: hypothetical protein [unclassified Neisseria]|uniref:hypothetical protein n=1 Tax=unclassified Neisseria TaxID=2623750 RepID=UPI00107180E4|nr:MULTISPECIES: hypothetical protein [unclassified Neisseria]MBF0804645.1 hypothetical protein [Neisseria sp. 19428wB4_WF04]TFU40345.1 hypothetical protein E4T99_09870 [Neisseria sp. WF04]